MIVLDKDEVVEPEPVVCPAAALHGVFLDLPPAGRGLARVEDPGARAADGRDKLRRERGDAGEPLEKVERNSLARENRSDRSLHRKDARPIAGALSIAL